MMNLGVLLGIIGIVIGVVSFAVAVPPFIQIWYGRPELFLGVDDFTGPDGKTLFITMRNKTTSGRFLKMLGVTREVGDVTADFDIQEQGTNKFIVKNVSGRLHNAVLRQSGLMVRAFPGRTIGLSVIHVQNDGAYIVDGRSDDVRQIAAGDYVVHAVIFCGEQIYRLAKNLKIGSAPHLTHWY